MQQNSQLTLNLMCYSYYFYSYHWSNLIFYYMILLDKWLPSWRYRFFYKNCGHFCHCTGLMMVKNARKIYSLVFPIDYESSYDFCFGVWYQKHFVSDNTSAAFHPRNQWRSAAEWTVWTTYAYGYLAYYLNDS